MSKFVKNLKAIQRDEAPKNNVGEKTLKKKIWNISIKTEKSKPASAEN